MSIKKMLCIIVIVIIPLFIALYVLYTAVIIQNHYKFDLIDFFEKTYNASYRDTEGVLYMNRMFTDILGNNQKGDKIVDYIERYVKYQEIDNETDDDKAVLFKISYYGNVVVEDGKTYGELKTILKDLNANENYNVYISEVTHHAYKPNTPIIRGIIIASKETDISNLNIVGDASSYDIKLHISLVNVIFRVSVMLALAYIEVVTIRELKKSSKK